MKKEVSQQLLQKIRNTKAANNHAKKAEDARKSGDPAKYQAHVGLQKYFQIKAGNKSVDVPNTAKHVNDIEAQHPQLQK